MTDLQAEIIAALRDKGPLLGKELAEALPREENIALWQACFSSDDIQVSFFSRYYLRYDITRDDMVRLSPSILRDFLSFNLFSLAGQRDALIERQVVLSNHHREVSQWKLAIARNILKQIMTLVPPAARDVVCAFVAGDVAYFLGHNEPREVAALGEMVTGSDIDIIIVHDGLSDETVAAIDKEMLGFKNYYLRHPDYRQEVDYVCKTKAKMFSQMRYEDIHHKIASKIAYEGMFAAGSIDLYTEIKDMLVSSGVQRLIELDFEHGLENRKRAMQKLLSVDPATIDTDTESLFFFSQERVEFT
ncbi:MAG: hypothetical protein AAFX03_04920 [Pseudomonadota bacterium]